MKPLDIWTKATPLSRTPARFGNREKVAEYQKFFATSSSVPLIEAITKRTEQGAGFFEALQNATQATAPDRERRRELENELQAEIFRHVTKGALLAFGYSCPRNVTDTPLQVPADLWQGRINWETDSIQQGSLKMEAVRLYPAEWIKEKTEKPRTAGRPTRQQQVIEAFHTLRKDGQIDFSKPKTACYPDIREWVLKHYPDEELGTGRMGTKAMEKHINPLFNTSQMKPL